MIIVWIIGLILCLLAIWVIKHSVIVEVEYNRTKKEYPVLRLWMVIVLIVLGLIPIISLLAAAAAFITMFMGYAEGEVKCKVGETRIGKLLNKPIK